MNIFMLDYDVERAAEYHMDKHVVKMILEYAQLLSTSHRLLDGIPTEEPHPKTGKLRIRYKLDDKIMDNVLYNTTHRHHPSCLWVCESTGNYDYVYNLMIALGHEYTYRYGKEHLTITKLEFLLEEPPYNMPNLGRTDVKLAMPDEFKMDDPVDSYRAYYRGAKQELATWKNRNQPEWY